MKALQLYLPIAFTALAVLSGCSKVAKQADVSDSIRVSLDGAGLKDVSISQDRDKGIVTLGGHVAMDNDKRFEHAKSDKTETVPVK